MLLHLSRTLREVHRMSRETSTEKFQDEAFEAMKRLIRFDSGCWCGGREPVEAVIMHYNFLHRLPVEEMNAIFEEVKCRPNHIKCISNSVINAQKALIIDVREAGIDDLYGKFGVDQIVTLYQRDLDLGLYHVLSIFRSGEERFTEDERLLFESAVPHLLDAFRENRLLHISGNNREVCPLTPAAALLDREGVVHFARPAFIELLRREWTDWHGPYVPETMRRMEEGYFSGEEVAVRFTAQNDGLYLAVMRRKGLLDLLTARELEVAKQIARGLSHKEIALQLNIAPATARNHISRVHDKLAAGKSTQISAMLLNEGWL